jgi:hypothetical protein
MSYASAHSKSVFIGVSIRSRLGARLPYRELDHAGFTGAGSACEFRLGQPMPVLGVSASGRVTDTFVPQNFRTQLTTSLLHLPHPALSSP